MSQYHSHSTAWEYAVLTLHLLQKSQNMSRAWCHASIGKHSRLESQVLLVLLVHPVVQECQHHLSRDNVLTIGITVELRNAASWTRFYLIYWIHIQCHCRLILSKRDRKRFQVWGLGSPPSPSVCQKDVLMPNIEPRVHIPSLFFLGLDVMSPLDVTVPVIPDPFHQFFPEFWLSVHHKKVILPRGSRNATGSVVISLQNHGCLAEPLTRALPVHVLWDVWLAVYLIGAASAHKPSKWCPSMWSWCLLFPSFILFFIGVHTHFPRWITARLK